MILAADHEVLSIEEERALGDRWQRKRDRQALDRLVACNVRTAKYFAKNWQYYCDAPLDEIEHVALLGIWEAAQRFDPARGNRFSTYAAHWVRASLQKHLERDCVIPAPKAVAQWRRRIAYASDQIVASGASPTADAIHARISITHAHTKRKPSKRGIRDLLGTMRVASLDAESDGHPPLSDIIADQTASPEEALETRQMNTAVFEFVGDLVPMQSLIINRRYRLGRKLAEIGRELGITRERVRQLEARALELVRSACDAGSVHRSPIDEPAASDPVWLEYGDVFEHAIRNGLRTTARLSALAKRLWPKERSKSRVKHGLAWLILQGRIERRGALYRVVE